MPHERIFTRYRCLGTFVLLPYIPRHANSSFESCFFLFGLAFCWFVREKSRKKNTILKEVCIQHERRKERNRIDVCCLWYAIVWSMWTLVIQWINVTNIYSIMGVAFRFVYLVFISFVSFIKTGWREFECEIEIFR